MTYSKGPWIYDAESGEIHTKDHTGFWGPDHEPVVVATVEPLDGINNGPLLAAAPELLDALKLALHAVVYLRLQFPRSKEDDSFDVLAHVRAVIARAGEEQ